MVALMTRQFSYVFLAAALVAASGCGGSGTAGVAPATAAPSSSASASPTASATATPTSTASATATPTSTASAAPTPTGSPVAASGTVVDYNTNSGLAGVPIAINPGGSGVPYTVVATTAPDGTFTFTAPPGTYELAVGSNSSSDNVRATAHEQIAIYAGQANPLTAPIPSPIPQVTLAPSQLSGSFRLATLSATEQGCFAGVNTGRTAAGVSPLIVDEVSLELSRDTLAEELAQNSDTPSPLYSNPAASLLPPGFDVLSTGAGFSTCAAYTDTYNFQSGSVPYPVAVAPTVTWFAGSFGSGSLNYVNEVFGIDPSSTLNSSGVRRGFAARR
jgi:hypothetical protein